MYKEGYVVAVVANGSAVEESDRRVCLPFGIEYKVRMINKNSKRCASDLLVNGEKVGRFILDSGETADIERFLDGNLKSGQRFKFVSLNNPGVKDKNDIDNGLIEVHFFEEIIKPLPTIIKEEHHHHHWDSLPYIPPHTHPEPYPPPKKWPDPYWNQPYFGDNIIHCNGGMDSTIAFSSSNYKGMSAGMCMNTSQNMEGATIRGAESKQEFKEVTGYEFSSIPVIIKLKIVNGEVQPSIRYCAGCGRKRRESEKFCSNCGTKY